MVLDTTDMGEEGLEIGKLYDYDIIILDLMLPDMDGEVLGWRLRASKGNAGLGYSRLDRTRRKGGILEPVQMII